MTITEVLESFNPIFGTLHINSEHGYVEPEFFAIAVMIARWIEELCQK